MTVWWISVVWRQWSGWHLGEAGVASWCHQALSEVSRLMSGDMMSPLWPGRVITRQMIIIRVSPDNAGHCIDTLVTHCTHRGLSTPYFSLVRLQESSPLIGQCSGWVWQSNKKLGSSFSPETNLILGWVAQCSLGEAWVKSINKILLGGVRKPGQPEKCSNTKYNEAGTEPGMVWGMCCIRYDGDRCPKCEYFNMLISEDPDHYQTLI